MYCSSVTSIVLPVIGSYRALKHNDLQMSRTWLTYWVVLSLQMTLEFYLSFLLFFVPFFQMFRFLFILWLVLPQTQGAAHIYIVYIGPFFDRHDKEIDQCMELAYSNALELSSRYLTTLVEFIKNYMYLFFDDGKKPLNPNYDDQNRNGTGQQQTSSISFPEFSTSTGYDRNTIAQVGAGAANIFNTFMNRSKSDGQQGPQDSPQGVSSSPTRSGPDTTPSTFTKTSLLDSFFSKFKTPPSLSSSEPPNQAAPNTDAQHPVSVFGSFFEPIAKAGATAIQSGLFLPKISAETHQAQLDGGSGSLYSHAGSECLSHNFKLSENRQSGVDNTIDSNKTAALEETYTNNEPGSGTDCRVDSATDTDSVSDPSAVSTTFIPESPHISLEKTAHSIVPAHKSLDIGNASTNTNPKDTGSATTVSQSGESVKPVEPTKNEPTPFQSTIVDSKSLESCQNLIDSKPNLLDTLTGTDPDYEYDFVKYDPEMDDINRDTKVHGFQTDSSAVPRADNDNNDKEESKLLTEAHVDTDKKKSSWMPWGH